ncbi:hypothetical protein ES703_78189 [subsurface metagenome]
MAWSLALQVTYYYTNRRQVHRHSFFKGFYTLENVTRFTPRRNNTTRSLTSTDIVNSHRRNYYGSGYDTLGRGVYPHYTHGVLDNAHH